MNWCSNALVFLADASTDEVDRTVRESRPGWKLKAIYQTLRNGDAEAWTIVGILVGVIVLVVVAKIVSKKLLDG